MQPDMNKYLPMLDDFDMSHEHKIQFIHDLWRIMESFVDRAFGIHPTQQCGKKNSGLGLQDSIKSLDSSLNPKQTRPPPEEGGAHE